ncbi:hypothetical protein RJT34_27466 [Clitoria ternatea]|uniref:Uncharacterized protein n=1 Tax=Clitoria ternatea TaxID=43366 RepID=A0AAN9FA00_CLITE
MSASSYRNKGQETSIENYSNMAGAGASSVRLDESTEISGEHIEKAFTVAWEAHTKTQHYYTDQEHNQSQVFIAFSGSGSVKDWYYGSNFGEIKINLDLFPSLKSIGNDEPALVNGHSQQRFQYILNNSNLQDEVHNAMNENKQIVFAGHSSGGPMAILATIWVLENYLTPSTHWRERIPILCVTFGSPLVGNHIFSHAIARENWWPYFLHIVMRYDVVPRIFLAPRSSVDQGFQRISEFLNPESESFMNESAVSSTEASDFYFAVMSNAAIVTSHAASKLMGGSGTDSTLKILANFIPISPYRPFGTYVFCTGSGNEAKQIVVRNPDAVLQLMFFSAQLSVFEEADQVSHRSLREHIIKDNEVEQSLGLQSVVYLDRYREANDEDALNEQDVVYLDQLRERPLGEEDDPWHQNVVYLDQLRVRPHPVAEGTSNDQNVVYLDQLMERPLAQDILNHQSVVYLDQLSKLPLTEQGLGGSTSIINTTLNALGLGTRGVLCLRAAAEMEVQRCKHDRRMDKTFIEEKLKKLEGYKEKWEHERGGYYEAFKVHEYSEDLEANVKRLELGGVWDDIVDKVRNYELPHEFEGKQEWIELGTRFRQLVEPLDIANYYRLGSHVSGTYKGKGRPRRYRYTQRWLEHAQRCPHQTNPESCFWADFEDLCNLI